MAKPFLPSNVLTRHQAQATRKPGINIRRKGPARSVLHRLTSRAWGVLLLCVLISLSGCDNDFETPINQDELEVSTVEQVFVDTTRDTPSSGDFPAQPTRTLESLVFLPQGFGKFPLLIFSHGLGGSPELNAQLLERVASAGFVIVAPAFPLTNQNAPAGPDGADTQQQPGDVSFLIDSVLAAVAAGEAPFAELVDVERIGTFGHSNGGITTLGIAANSCCRDPRIDTAVVLSGNPAPFGGGEYAYDDTPPIMLVHGTADVLVPYEGSVGVFNQLHNAKAMVTLNDVDHSSYLIPGGPGYDTVSSSIIDFFRAHLLGDAEASVRLESGEVKDTLAELRYTATGGTDVTLPLPPPITDRNAAAEPTTGLTDGQVVTVTWENFSPATVNVLQCSGGGTGGSAECDFTKGKILQANPSGEGSLALEIILGEVGTGRCDATIDDCVILVNDGGLPDPEATIRIPISFAP